MIEVGLPVTITYSRTRHSSAQLRNGTAHLKIASHLPIRERQRHADELLRKIAKRLYRARKANALLPHELVDGMDLTIWGEPCTVSLKTGARRRIRLHNSQLHLTLPALPADTASHTAAWTWLRRGLGRLFSQRLETYAQELNNRSVRSGRLASTTFREQTTRWGSCSPSGRISLSSRLLLMPPGFLEYVCLHELCHLVRPDHSPRFWALVEQHMPDAARLRRELRQYI